MEERKKKEIEYYDKIAKEQGIGLKESGSRADFNPFILGSYNALKKIAQEKCKGKKVLDYGCGSGIHSAWLENIASKVVAIDLSENSLEIARKRAPGVEFVKMDCEKMNFEDNSFDVVFDGGTFSSLDISKAFPEICRVLKPGGFLTGIETLGHNPILNLNRRLNKKKGSRTSWAESHIFKIKDIKKAEKYFEIKQLRFFHLVSWVVFPFLRFSGARFALRLMEAMERGLVFILPFFKRYSFKIVFVFKK